MLLGFILTTSDDVTYQLVAVMESGIVNW